MARTKAKDFDSRAGRAVSGLVEGKAVAPGNATFLQDLSVDVSRRRRRRTIFA